MPVTTMAGILSVLKAQGLNCLPTGSARIDYECFDEYRESNERAGQNAFESDPTVSDIRSLTTTNDSDSLLRFFLGGSRKKYKVADVVASIDNYQSSLPRFGAAVLKRNITAKIIQPREEFLSLRGNIAFRNKVNERLH